MPIHLTARPGGQQADALARRRSAIPLLAIAPQPGAPVGRSQRSARRRRRGRGRALQARPGLAAGKPVRPGRASADDRALRAVAWPTPTAPSRSATAMEQMWLWRGEIGLWEKDPATPLNFRGNLLGVAFDPNEPARGYAVGTTRWAKEACCCATARPGPRKPTFRPQAQGAASPRSRSPARKRSSRTASRSDAGDRPIRRRPARQRRLRLAGRRQERLPRCGSGRARGRGGRCPTAAPRSHLWRSRDGATVYERESAGRALAGRAPAARRRAPRARWRCSAKAARCARSSPAAG